MADKIDFPVWLQGEMDNNGLSQSDLARLASVTRSAINGVLTGSRGPGNELCIGIANALKIPPEEVFRAAGLLPEVTIHRAQFDELHYLLGQLDDENLQEVIDYARHRLEKQGKADPSKQFASRIRRPARSVLKEK